MRMGTIGSGDISLHLFVPFFLHSPLFFLPSFLFPHRTCDLFYLLSTFLPFPSVISLQPHGVELTKRCFFSASPTHQPLSNRTGNWNGCTSMYISLPIAVTNKPFVTRSSCMLLLHHLQNSHVWASSVLSLSCLCAPCVFAPDIYSLPLPSPKANAHRIANKGEDIFSAVKLNSTPSPLRNENTVSL